MKVRFWGVRGSLPVPGPKTERYGGNTSCVEVRSAAGTRIIVDAGTGIRKLGKELAPRSRRAASDAHLLISHTHWDHIQGLPFFSPLYQRGQQAARSTRASATTCTCARCSPRRPTIPTSPSRSTRPRPTSPSASCTDAAKFEIADVKVACARLNHPYIATAYA